MYPELSGESERELILRYQQTGDPEILGRIFSPYTGMIYGVCLKYLKDRDDAKDAVMQIFEKLVSTLRAHKIDNFKSWLYVTSRNHCLMHLRANKGKFREEISDSLMENDIALHHHQEEPDMEENLVKLEDCIKQLATEQQSCVRYFFLDEKCYKDISSITGFDLNKVKSNIQNGKRNLKICMERNA